MSTEAGSPYIGHLGLRKDQALDHARQAREMVNQFAKVRVVERVLSVAPIQTTVYVVMLWPVVGSAADKISR